MTDSELIAHYVRSEAKERDATFRPMVDRYAGMVHAACVRQLHDAQLAEDATQAVFLLLSERAGTVREGKLAGWLLGVARFVCSRVKRERLRRDRRERAAPLRNEAVMHEAHAELRELLDDGLMRLGPDDREALALRYLGDQPLQNVAGVMGITEEAARKRVTRAIEKLRHHFARHGVTAGAAVVISMLGAEAARAAQAGPPLIEKVLHTCSAGANATSRAAQLAQGAKVMMNLSRLKTAAAAAVLLLIAGVAVWATAHLTGHEASAMAATEIAAPAKPVAPAATPATQPAAKRATPTQTIDTLCDALHAGDRAATYACIAVDPNRKPTLLDGTLESTLAENRLTLAALKAFGPPGQQVRTMTTGDEEGLMIKQLFGSFDEALQTKIDGDTARLTMAISPDILQLIPKDLRGDLADLAKKPLFLKKVNGEWLFDLDRTLKVTVDLGPAPQEMTPAQLKQRDIDVLFAFSKGLDDVAARIASGELPTVAHARRALRDLNAQVLGQFDAKYLNFSTDLVGDPPK